MSVRVRGVEEANRNLSKAISGIKGDVFDGLKAAALFIQGKSVERAPADTGALRNSAFTSVERGNDDKPRARVGYTIDYAPYVHEMPETYNYSTPNTGPKFLERAVTENLQTILNIIRRRARR